MEVREMPTPICCDYRALVVLLRFGRGERGKYSCKDRGRGDILVSWEAEPPVAAVGDYGDEAREATEKARIIRPEIHIH
jgi:hypothetical protein